MKFLCVPVKLYCTQSEYTFDVLSFGSVRHVFSKISRFEISGYLTTGQTSISFTPQTSIVRVLPGNLTKPTVE